MVVAELWLPSDDEIVLINKAAPFGEIKLSSYRNTLFMAEDVLDKLRCGHTNLEELIRTLPYTCLRQLWHLSQQRLRTAAKQAS